MARQFDRFTVRADGLDGTRASQYEATVLGMLRSLETSQVGRAVLNGFRFYQRELLVYPYDGKLGRCNARTYSDWGMFRTKLSFSPRDWFGTSPCHPAGTVGPAPHVVFVHEMTHALRSAAKKLGTFNRLDEEAAAVMVENAYASEINLGSRPGWPADPADFLTNYRSVVVAFQRQLPDFFRWIAEVDVAYNPARLYYLTLQGVPRLKSA